MTTQSLDLARELPAAIRLLGIQVPGRVVNALLGAEQQQKGPCIAQCVHHGKMTFVLWRDPKGFQLPEHIHDCQEQMSAVIEGKFEVTLNGKSQVCGPRSKITIPAGVPHSGEAQTRCIVLDVFRPGRPDFPGLEVP